MDKMSIAEAKEKLAGYEKEFNELRGQGPAEREYRAWLGVQISTFDNAITKFEKENEHG